MDTDSTDEDDVNDEDYIPEPEVQSKRKKRHTPAQIQELRAVFEQCNHPDEKTRRALGTKIGLEARQAKAMVEDGKLVRQEHATLMAENVSLRHAMVAKCCSACGGGTVSAEPSPEKRRLLAENSRLKDEHMRANSILHKVLLEVTPSAGHPTTHPRLSTREGWSSRAALLRLAEASMEQFLMLATKGEPLWVPTPDGEVMSYQAYQKKTLPVHHGVCPNGFFREATREAGIVRATAADIVDILTDTNLWLEMFPSVVASVTAGDVICGGSPRLRNHSISFLRYSRLTSERQWAVMDVSVEGSQCSHKLDLNVDSSEVPAWNTDCRLLPSGCLLEDIGDGCCKTTVPTMFRPLFRSGKALGAHRWLASLQRQCEVLAPSSNIDEWHGGAGTGAERIDVAVRMVTWKKAGTMGGEPAGLVLSASTTVWLPNTPPQRVFEYLCNDQRRGEWDTFANGSAVEEIKIVILQEVCADASCSMVVYAPVEEESMRVVMNSGDHATVFLLPSGFAILPDGHGKARRHSLLPGSPSGDQAAMAFNDVGRLLCRAINKIKAAVKAKLVSGKTREAARLRPAHSISTQGSKEGSADCAGVPSFLEQANISVKTMMEDGIFVQREHAALMAENVSLRHAILAKCCSACGGGTTPFNPSPEKLRLLAENAMLHDEHMRAINLPVPSVADGWASRAALRRHTEASMEEFIVLATGWEPLWVMTPDGEALSYQVYQRETFPVQQEACPNGFFREATREAGIVRASVTDIVNILTDAMFPGIVAGANASDVVCGDGVSTRDGLIQLMNAELWVQSPRLRNRRVSFLRYSRMTAPKQWAVMDVSVDGILFLAPQRSQAWRTDCRLLPSGCLVEDMDIGYCKVTWIVHADYDLTMVPNMFKPLFRSGKALGAHRWLASSPLCTRAMFQAATAQLAQRMMASFYSAVSGPVTQPSSNINEWHGDTGTGAERIDVAVRMVTWQKAGSMGGEPAGLVLSASSTVWLPNTPPQLVFEYLCNDQRRGKWDTFANGGAAVLSSIATGHLDGNAVSILRPNKLILQEVCADASCSMVVYAPVEVGPMCMVMNSGDHAAVFLLPSGSAVLPDGHGKARHAPCTSSALEGHGNTAGSLVTVACQTLVPASPSGDYAAGAFDGVGMQLCRAIKNVKAAVTAKLVPETRVAGNAIGSSPEDRIAGNGEQHTRTRWTRAVGAAKCGGFSVAS
ncbi:hypothetical protein HU200_061288 [Digitaria exilis]|uniref:START domain-containing protein n=1 Tax=Digitaria exilis TaxID=1010633 RepID=A0A835AF76_9POAL|nr:hypothetical protein HU200_061288 [Digitaria exilis]